MDGVFAMRKTGSRVLFGVVVCGYSAQHAAVPCCAGHQHHRGSTDVLAKVGRPDRHDGEVRQQLDEFDAGTLSQAPRRPLCQKHPEPARFQKEIGLRPEAGASLSSDQERADRIKQYVPTAFNATRFVGMDAYAAEVQSRISADVPVFEDLVKQAWWKRNSAS